jgi:hypothetical protein
MINGIQTNDRELECGNDNENMNFLVIEMTKEKYLMMFHEKNHDNSPQTEGISKENISDNIQNN